ncbi:MAG: heme O synthase [Candidatus Westeberhardia cardiocondylae]|nr:heme O synthase [Candidatus Westeberhardia cardiocondylae]
MILHYIALCKPSIVLANLISLISGFIFASKYYINYTLLLFISFSMCLIIAASCVFNNYIDYNIDKKMQRTKNRILVKKLITKKNSLIYAIILTITGFLLLYHCANIIVICLAKVSFIIYVIIYSIFMKTSSPYSVLTGSISGAIPITIGYCSVTNTFDTTALLLFLIFIFWQIPHSYSLIILKFQEYKTANIPTMVSKIGIPKTKKYIKLYICIFALLTSLLTMLGHTGYTYLLTITTMNIWWIMTTIQKNIPTKNYAKKIFTQSIIIIMTFDIMISIDYHITLESLLYSNYHKSFYIK